MAKKITLKDITLKKRELKSLTKEFKQAMDNWEFHKGSWAEVDKLSIAIKICMNELDNLFAERQAQRSGC